MTEFLCLASKENVEVLGREGQYVEELPERLTLLIQ